MRLIVTDVTEMRSGNYCVAGWNAQTQRTVRPLPDGANWSAALLQQHAVIPGASIDVVPTRQHQTSAFPHRTEDTPVDRAAIRAVSSGPIDWFARGAPLTHATVSDAFAGHVRHNGSWHDVRQGVHVLVGTQVGSLAAVRLPRNAVRFVEEFDKLRVVLNDGSISYKLAVSSLALKDAWRQGGLAAVPQALPATQQFHLRLGLAREFDDPPTKCYLMVNGIHG